MATSGCNETTQRIALLERVSDLFDRFGSLVPLAIAFLNGWPTEIKFYSEFVVGNAWKVFLSCILYQLAAFVLKRAVTFASGSLNL